MTNFRSAIATALACSLLFLGGCNTPDAISKFCTSSIATLASASAVFDDMKQSCLREVSSRQEIGAFKPAVQSDSGCTEIGTQVDQAKEAAKILSDFFSALNSLASFGAAKAGTDAQTLAKNATSAAGGGSSLQAAVGGIAQFIVSAATSGYQQKKLAQDIPAVSGNVANAIAGLVTLIKVNYASLLAEEEKKLSVQYQEFAKNNATAEKPLSPDTRLALYDRFEAQEAALVARRASAQSLIEGLQAISKGFTDLAANAHNITAKELSGLLAPYVSQIQALIPSIQKAF